MSEITEADIEIVARAICAGHGFDPDEKRMDDNGWLVPRWILLRSQATTHIAAFRACRDLGQPPQHP